MRANLYLSFYDNWGDIPWYHKAAMYLYRGHTKVTHVDLLVQPLYQDVFYVTTVVGHHPRVFTRKTIERLKLHKNKPVKSFCIYPTVNIDLKRLEHWISSYPKFKPINAYRSLLTGCKTYNCTEFVCEFLGAKPMVDPAELLRSIENDEINFDWWSSPCGQNNFRENDSEGSRRLRLVSCNTPIC